jgi:hypothetical protein
MRVKCINDKWDPSYDVADAPLPIFLNDYTVLDTVDLFGKAYYALVEFGDEFLYEAAFFATLPDQPAEVTEEEIVNLQPA